MFKRFEASGETVTILFDGQPVAAPAGSTIAAALLGAGIRAFRETPVSGAPRGPFCMMGACYDCLVRVNGETVQGCMTQVQDGLLVARVARPQDPAIPEHPA